MNEASESTVLFMVKQLGAPLLTVLLIYIAIFLGILIMSIYYRNYKSLRFIVKLLLVLSMHVFLLGFCMFLFGLVKVGCLIQDITIQGAFQAFYSDVMLGITRFALTSVIAFIGFSFSVILGFIFIAGLKGKDAVKE